MPDVGLFTAAKPLDSDYKVVIKIDFEVEGLPVYQESYDVKALAKELEDDPERLATIWMRRLKCAAHCRQNPGFCLVDGTCADLGHANADKLDQAGEER